MYTKTSTTAGGLVRRPINPRLTNTMIDANALDDKEGSAGAAVDELLALIRDRKINAVLPHSVKAEIEHPNTPAYVKERASGLVFSVPVELNAQEHELRRRVLALMRGNAKPEKHEADARHIVEAGKYGSFFITNDKRRPIKMREAIAELIPNLWIVTPEEFLEIYREHASRRPSR